MNLKINFLSINVCFFSTRTIDYFHCCVFHWLLKWLIKHYDNNMQIRQCKCAVLLVKLRCIYQTNWAFRREDLTWCHARRQVDGICICAKHPSSPVFKSTQAITLLVQESLMSSSLQANKNLSCGNKLRSKQSRVDICVCLCSWMYLWVCIFGNTITQHAFTSIQWYIKLVFLNRGGTAPQGAFRERWGALEATFLKEGRWCALGGSLCESVF